MEAAQKKTLVISITCTLTSSLDQAEAYNMYTRLQAV